ncbi:ATP-binding protein [Alkalimarinus alittae]|uniref:ATP-grasp domain-containing protein n=1 Tax=Alkalimarinus alittae TaxID=2961619 RepID=A0ABY6MZ10_9ALTE|nr:biotin carboxylase N-terminal domain-containing protein [Alkalimarinus alittae]UZE95068.1 ATP-grasp domain-containing protein [Alkalimarinus alittae]
MSEVQRNKNIKKESASALLLSLEEYARETDLLRKAAEKESGAKGVINTTPARLNQYDIGYGVLEGKTFIAGEDLIRQANALRQTTGELYQQQVLIPAESSDRSSVIKLIAEISERIISETKEGPLYIAEVELSYGAQTVRLGIVAQNRQINNGVWKPKHHRKAGQWVRKLERRQIPIVTFIDTPGADAGADANLRNQAHSISELIATMADLNVPTIGIVWGFGYSGGAIPLAATNLLLSVRDGIFSTIQPKGLASIARKQKLDWQTCARLVGVSAPELFQEGIIDGVIDYSPLEGSQNRDRIKAAIFTSLAQIENQSLAAVKKITSLSQHYIDVSRLISAGNEELLNKRLAPHDVKGFPSIFGFAYSAIRSLKLRARLKTQSVKLKESSSDVCELPISPDEQQRILSDSRFSEWLKRSDKLIYEDGLFKSWSRYRESEQHRGDERGYIASLFLGNPKGNFEKALHELSAEIAFYLYNGWQQESQHHLNALIKNLEGLEHEVDCNVLANEQLSFIDLIQDSRFKPVTINHCKQLIRFDCLYENLLTNLTEIVSEFSDHKKISEALLQSMLHKSGIETEEQVESFSGWLMSIRNTSNFGEFLRTAEQWKKVQHPRSSDVVFVVASYFFEKLFPELFESQKDNKTFSGQFNPVFIGRRKDFWNRLNQAIKDLRIQSILNDIKPGDSFTPEALIDTLFQDFMELDSRITTANPKRFPGFGEAIIRQQVKSKSASGLITGVAEFSVGDDLEPVGLFVSNHSFQAGAFDMSSAERFCRLLAYCGEYAIPVIGFISSGGMQTKEGASALFSMAVVNDQINRFVGDLGLPILMFGYGDCTGGAQASLVTHPLVETYYFSGTNMPFAGRIVVPEYLPVTATLANYLVAEAKSMQGLVKHPMFEGLDERLNAIDPAITSAVISVSELINRWLTHKDLPGRKDERKKKIAVQKFEPYEKVLVHARGCTAVKLIREAHAMDLQVVLVQSDPDMDSVAADMLKEGDNLVCLGGYTSDESYLNGDSVLRIAEMYGAEALHPGIGFLSENSQFAYQCIAQGLNFIGPSPESMEAMGDKSKAIHTSIELGVPVVPGSHGLLKNIGHAEKIASEIGFPIILKAAHGGGGKGIVVVEKAEQLKELFYMIKAEARNSFGSGDIYLERLVTRFRHIEVQLLRDRFGCTRIIGLRDCSIQRNKQKIIEESISTALPPEQEKIAKDSAYKLAEACNYHGAGTVEFIYDLDRESLYFMEMNTRLQVEHPVTELVSGIDIVREQYRIAMGESIEAIPLKETGYAIEVRINAESVSVEKGELKVVPTPGLVSKCLFPKVEGVTHIVTVDNGKTIPPFYDNLIAQVIVHGDSREDATQKMSEYLAQVIIEGVDTNIALLQVILKDPVFVSGEYDTGYLLDLVARGPEELSALQGAVTVKDAAAEDFSIVVDGSDELKVLAPSTSIMYRSASPDQPAYIEEGDTVTVDQTLCLLEAMKMFQPLSLSSFNKKGKDVYPADQKYKITHIKGVAGQQVNRGDLLFVIKPVKVEA